MPRSLLVPADGTRPLVEIHAAGYEALNRAVGASYGDAVTVARLPAGVRLCLWIDDEGALQHAPVGNARASAMAGRALYGDALLHAVNAAGEHVDLPAGAERQARDAFPPAGEAGFRFVDIKPHGDRGAR